jgi:hypothetical protein
MRFFSWIFAIVASFIFSITAQPGIIMTYTVQPDYVLPCSSQTVTGGLCTLKVYGSRQMAKALYLSPKSDTGLFMYVNTMSEPTGNVFYPQKLFPGEWIGVLGGILQTTGSTADIDSIWWARKDH